MFKLLIHSFYKYLFIDFLFLQIQTFLTELSLSKEKTFLKSLFQLVRIQNKCFSATTTRRISCIEISSRGFSLELILNW